MRVLWTVSGYYFGNDAGMTEDVAKTYLFKPLDIDETRIVFDGQQCSNVVSTQMTVNIHAYLENVWHVSPQTLKIEEQSAKVIQTNCDMPLFHEYVRLQDGSLMARLNGVVFTFEPNVMR